MSASNNLFPSALSKEESKVKTGVKYNSALAEVLAFRRASAQINRDAKEIKVGKGKTQPKAPEDIAKGAGIDHGRKSYGNSSSAGKKVTKGLTKRQKLVGIVTHAAEVVIKIDKAKGYDGVGRGTVRSCKYLQAVFSYISRKGSLDVVDSKGETLDMTDLKARSESWTLAQGVSLDGIEQILARKIVISMPAKTDINIFTESVDDWCKVNLKNHGFEYVYAIHTDRDHPHAHIVVQARNRANRLFSPKKKDLQFYRENFASIINEKSGCLVANATLRAQRGKTIKGKSIAQYYAIQKNRAKRKLSKVEEAVYKEAKQIASEYKKTGKSNEPHISMKKAQKTRDKVLKNADKFAKELEMEGNSELSVLTKNYFSKVEKKVKNTEDLIVEKVIKEIDKQR